MFMNCIRVLNIKNKAQVIKGALMKNGDNHESFKLFHKPTFVIDNYWLILGLRVALLWSLDIKPGIRAVGVAVVCYFSFFLDVC